MVRKHLIRSAAAVVMFGVISVSGVASGAGLATTTVTIKTQNGDFWGRVDSSKPAKCANNRKIWLYEQKGNNQNPSNDKRVASDTSSLNGGHYEWNTGNTGLKGRYYARAGKIPGCAADTSPTVHT